MAVVLAGVISACSPPVSRPPAPVPTPAPAPVPAAPVTPAPRPALGTIAGEAGALWYHVVGSGPDTVLVPLGSWLDPALAPLGDRHTVVFYDPRHRGQSHGLSDSTHATFEGDVADLEAMRRALGISRAAVIGYDYYAAVVSAWAARHPDVVSRLVLLSPIEPLDSLARAYNPPERLARLDTVAARALVKARAAGRDTTDLAGYCDAFWRVNARLFVGDTAQAAGIHAEWCRLANESPARVARAAGLALSSLGEGSDLGRMAEGVTAPTLVIQGRRDLVANPDGAREWARRIPGARVLTLTNVGHLPHLEAGPQVVEAIAEFLGGRFPPRATPP